MVTDLCWKNEYRCSSFVSHSNNGESICSIYCSDFTVSLKEIYPVILSVLTLLYNHIVECCVLVSDCMNSNICCSMDLSLSISKTMPPQKRKSGEDSFHHDERTEGSICR
jgi:hypothetical protein